MLLQFNIHYLTTFGQRLMIKTNYPKQTEIELTYQKDGQWQGEWQTSRIPANFTYQYVVMEDEDIIRQELEYPRTLAGIKGDTIVIEDSWRNRELPVSALYASAFEDVIFKPLQAVKMTQPKRTKGKVNLHFQLLEIRVPTHLTLAIIGNTEVLGNWGASGILKLDNTTFPLWQTVVSARPGERLEYKYVLVDKASNAIVNWETGPNRSCTVPLGVDVAVKSDSDFSGFTDNWKGSGVAMPVFSLRTKNSHGCGEFTDLKLLVDWAKKVGMQMVQILPVNDTIATDSWVDSYPYAAISVFALHPLYLSLDGLEKKINIATLKKKRKALNDLPAVDYEAVLKDKLSYARKVYDKVQKEWVVNAAFQQFFKENEHWLRPYAAFCYLRDQNKTANFNEWSTHQVYADKAIKKLTAPESKAYKDIAFYYYLQYHLDKQLADSTAYARSQGIVLKGDLPIGIYRYSADAWVEPHLYNMDGQAGAPPDDFATEGQNWGFPTYRWDVMAENGYQWWKQRFTQLSRYFDAFRIDHILGFFRIWETPIDQVEGIMGKFNPALPIMEAEFRNRGVYFDYNRFCQPFITWEIVGDIFGEEANQVIENYLEPFHDRLQLRPEYATQRLIEDSLPADQQHLKKGLFSLVSNVLFFAEGDAIDTHLHPRIDLQKTYSFRMLDTHTRSQVEDLYNDYFYHRQEDFWEEKGRTKLPAMKEATNMLICGEDLGMVPACVPQVMDDLGILTLEIQRMAKNPQTEFLSAADIPYWSVCSPSTHDMSPIRLWWEEESPDRRQRFYNNELGWWGEAPSECYPELAEAIIRQHLNWPTMWTVFPLQDILAMDGKIRNPDAEAERINVPAVKQHYWRYRMHLSMEELLASNDYNNRLHKMLAETGRA